MNVTASAGGGSSFFTLLGLAFIVLKLTGVIAWSWWWVLAPIWMPAVLAALIGGAFWFFVIRKDRW